MRTVQYHSVSVDGGGACITLFVGSQMYVADSNHPNFTEIVNKAMADDPSVVDLFDVPPRLSEAFARLSTRVTVSDSRIYVDHDEVDDVISEHIVKMIDEGTEDFKPLVNFLEKVADASEHTKANLYRWLTATGGFAIAPDGDILGYKGVNGDFSSVTAGPGFVNDVAVSGHLDNSPGNVLSIARSQVEANPAIGCASGLHVGTWGYASGFGSVVVLVKFHPRSVVSVPTDCSDQKMRVDRYEVLRRVTEPLSDTISE